MNKRGRIDKIIAGVITILVISLIVFLGPANALILNVDGFDNTPYTLGDTVNFQGTIEIQPDEILQLENITLMVNGYEVCSITVRGLELAPCEGIDMILTQYSVNYGYGYGYNEFGPIGGGIYEGAENYGYGYEGYYLGKAEGIIGYDIYMNTTHPSLFVSGGNAIKLIVNTPTQSLESNLGYMAIQPQEEFGDGEYIMSTYQEDMVLVGNYDSKDHILGGFLYFKGFDLPKYAAYGTYKPTSKDSGYLTFRLYNIEVETDVGVIWVGNYSEGKWYIRPEGFPEDSWIEGNMLIAPQ